jgi:hypothetical protein
MIAKRAAEILAGIAAGTYRFAPLLDPVTGVAAFPPGWRPAPWTPRFKTPKQKAGSLTAPAVVA